jgi:hypothetical protein
MASVSKRADRAKRLAIAATAVLLQLAVTACTAGSTKERMYFDATERCRNYFMDRIENSLEKAGSSLELERFLRELNKNAQGDFANLIRRSAAEIDSSIGTDKGASPLNDAQKLLVYQSISSNIRSISQCEKLEAYVSTYLLADQLRLTAVERKIPLSSSSLGVDIENQTEVARALLAELVLSYRDGVPRGREQ